MSSQSGFAILEALLGSVILASIVVGIAVAVMHTTQATTTFRSNQRMLDLTDMVFEQMRSVAIENYKALPAFDVVNQTPSNFVKVPEGMGFDKMLITTQSRYSENKSSCAVTVTVTYPKGSELKTRSETRYFNETTPVNPGAIVVVWAKVGCGTYTDPEDIRANCPGVAGAVVEATQAGNPALMVKSVADSMGKATLRKVQLGDNTQLRITAPVPSDFRIKPGQPGFVQAYMATSGSGFENVINSTISINNEDVANVIIVHQFKMAGMVTGRATNDLGTANYPDANVSLVSGSAAEGGSFRPCTSVGPCTVASDPDGIYRIYNVVPGPVQLGGVGRDGTPAKVLPSSASFVQGFAASAPVGDT
jgi:Tfp pilus assembly protein PilV